MKKLVVLLVVLVMVLCYVRINEANYFSFEAKVTEVQEDGFLCITRAGEEWYCEGKGFEKGDKVRLVVDSNGSDVWDEMEFVRVEKW